MDADGIGKPGWEIGAVIAAAGLLAAAWWTAGTSLGSWLAGACAVAALTLLAAGLAEFFVRRRERQLAGHVQQLALGLQASRDHVAREVELLAALVQRAEAWPQAVAGLGRLEAAWAHSQQEGQTQMLLLLRGAVQEFRAESKTSLEESLRASKEALLPLLEDATRRAAAAAGEPLAGLADQIAHSLAQRGAQESEHWRALERQLEGWLAGANAHMARQLGESLESVRQQSEAGEAAERGREARAAAQIAELASLTATLREEGERQRMRLAADSAALAESVAAQGRDLAQRFSLCADSVLEAAAGLQAGGGELGAAAALFSQAVDRHREAAAGWLANLGGVESALGAAVESAGERAGQGVAAEALREQLAASQRIFARQLEFQCELLGQLRSLRAPERGPLDDEVDELAAVAVEAQAQTGTEGERAGAEDV